MRPRPDRLIEELIGSGFRKDAAELEKLLACGRRGRAGELPP